jgi:transcription elongation factor Elf1
MIEETYSFNCPHCGEELTVQLDLSGGRKQSFVQDCEVCCKPIQIEVQFEGEEVVNFFAGPSE